MRSHPDLKTMQGQLRRSLVLLACACVAGCSGRPERAQAAGPVEVEASSAGELQRGTPVPDVPFTLQDKFQLQLPAMKGKIIAVFFCAALDDPQCLREADVLGEHHAQLHDDHHVVIIGVSPATPQAHKAFLAARHLPLDFASDPDGRIARAFAITEPHAELRMVVIDKQGLVRAVWHGRDPDRHVRDLLGVARE